MVEKSAEGSVRPILEAGPEINVGRKGSVVVPNAFMPQPAGLRRNVLLCARLEQCYVASHDGIIFLENKAGKNGMGKGPLCGLRPRAKPGIGILPLGIIVSEHRQICKSCGMPDHLRLRCSQEGRTEFFVEATGGFEIHA